MSERMDAGRWRSLGSVALLAAALGCTRIQPALTPPEAGGAPWRELTSTHVILRTDREEADAREALVELEQTFMALHDMGFPQLDVKNRHIVVVHFARQRDFKGVSPKGFDGRGNFTLGLREHIIFPEIDYDKIDKIKGMNITFVTSAKTDEHGRALLKGLGMPFRS